MSSGRLDEAADREIGNGEVVPVDGDGRGRGEEVVTQYVAEPEARLRGELSSTGGMYSVSFPSSAGSG